jgi:transcriptional regulator with XRE-family HTH domain
VDLLISPYVRRLRLGTELRALRAERGLTHEDVAKRIGQSRASISRLENGHAIDQAVVLALLDALGVGGERWTRIANIARDAGGRGWWHSHKDMGPREARYADLEAGAATIREFQMAFLPSLLQTPEFTRARVEAEGQGPSDGRRADRIVDARRGRQRMLRRPGGPRYEVVVDELAIRRRAAPEDVVRAQLYHICARANGDPNTSVRVLPTDADIAGHRVPRSGFSLYTYPDPDDPVVVVVDTVTEDLILTDEAEVRSYEDLYHRLLDAALPATDSLKLITTIAHATR